MLSFFQKNDEHKSPFSACRFFIEYKADNYLHYITFKANGIKPKVICP